MSPRPKLKHSRAASIMISAASHICTRLCISLSLSVLGKRLSVEDMISAWGVNDGPARILAGCRLEHVGAHFDVAVRK